MESILLHYQEVNPNPSDLSDFSVDIGVTNADRIAFTFTYSGEESSIIFSNLEIIICERKPVTIL